MKLLNGAFIANLIKGKSGSQEWQYTPNLAQIRKNSQKPGSMKEKPQFEVINEIEAAAADRFKSNLKDMTLSVTKHLLTFTKK